jgi:hypothetical protein
MGTAMAVAREDDPAGLGGVGLTPEEMLARAELEAIVRNIVAELPHRSGAAGTVAFSGAPRVRC